MKIFLFNHFIARITGRCFSILQNYILLNLLAIFQLTTVPDSYGQSCGTTSTTTLIATEVYPSWEGPCGNGDPIYVRVYPHILRAEGLTGEATSEIINTQFELLNEYFNRQNIYIIQACDPESYYIEDAEAFNNIDDYECYLYETYNHNDGIDVYFDGINSTSSYYGKAGDIPYPACVIGGFFNDYYEVRSDRVANTYIVAHEIGHCMGLYHTHNAFSEQWESLCTGEVHPAGIEENSSNCDSDGGDFCCDTPPDPNMQYYVDPITCVMDITGEPYDSYDPDELNIMSYTHPNCAYHFSDEQAGIMHCTLQQNDALKNCVIKSVANLEIETHTEWTTLEPNDWNAIVTGSLTIKSGNTLIIGEGVTLQFGDNAELIIEPNGNLLLYGTLTSVGCNSFWKGIKVYGDSEHNQQYSTGYHQGFLKGFPGSLIENALTGVELYGPSEDETGGVIVCNGTTFKNNKIGVSFMPYENIISGQPRDYVGSFSLCNFTIDDNFPFISFDQHLLLSGVNGIRISGCEFEYIKDNSEATNQNDLGWGIAAINSGFSITAANTGVPVPGPCIPGNCTITRKSSFTGLGKGVYSGSFGENKLFSIYQTTFNACITGIEVDGVSEGVMLFNNFYMGSLRFPNVLGGDQIGIKLNNELAGFTIEQDSFYSSDVNANNTIGISVEKIGAFNNVIRNNYFNGLTIANEAYGRNAGDIGLYSGLRYLCNENINTLNKDFFVKNTLKYNPDNINELQLDLSEPEFPLSAGNKFSSTGNPSDGDFANDGNSISEYHFHNSEGVLDDHDGISAIISQTQNTCGEDYCAPPCLSTNDLSDLKEDYFNYKIDYDYAILNNQNLEAAKNKAVMDNVSKLIIQHILVDTVSFSQDTLRAWYSRLLSYSGYILLAKDYLGDGNFEYAGLALDGISTKLTLDSYEENDIENIRTIFSILERQNAYVLPPGAIDTLIAITDSLGQCASIARSILTLHGYKFETNYVLPSVSPGYAVKPKPSNIAYDEISIYPNPNYGSSLNVYIPNLNNDHPTLFEMWTITGIRVISNSLPHKYSELILKNDLNGIHSYRVSSNGQILKTGRILFLN